MLTAAKAGLVAFAGLVLGTMLGEAVDPEMKLAPQAAWRSTLQPPAGARPRVEQPREIVPFTGLAPDADAVVAERWPGSSYSWWEDRPLEIDSYAHWDADAERYERRAAYAAYEPFPVEPEAEDAADQAERAADDAGLAAAPALPPEPLNADGQPGIW